MKVSWKEGDAEAKRWIDDVEEDLRSVSVKRWRKRGFDRIEWAAMVTEVKAKYLGTVELLEEEEEMPFGFEALKTLTLEGKQTCRNVGLTR